MGDELFGGTDLQEIPPTFGWDGPEVEAGRSLLLHAHGPLEKEVSLVVGEVVIFDLLDSARLERETDDRRDEVDRPSHLVGSPRTRIVAALCNQRSVASCTSTVDGGRGLGGTGSAVSARATAAAAIVAASTVASHRWGRTEL